MRPYSRRSGSPDHQSNERDGHQIWQKGYHDHIVRGEADYLRIWNYIDTNPAKWREDCYYCQNEGV